MRSALTLSRAALVLGLAACASEQNFGQDLVNWPDSRPDSPDSPIVEDRVVQVTTPEVDILFVIDNSCSMADNQTNLAQNFPAFLEFFIGSGLNYHIGVTSTDADPPSQACSGRDPLKGKLVDFQGQRWVDDTTLNPELAFATMVSMGTSGTGCEQGLNASFLATEVLRDTYNQGFYRDDASYHTIMVSDEQDQSEDWGSNLITLGEYKGWYDGLKDVVEDRTFSSIVCVEVDGYNCPQSQLGTRYIDVTNAIGGIVWEISDDDFSEVLERLGVQASGFEREYFLSQIPVVETITVEVHKTNGAVDVKTPGLEEDGGEYTYDEVRNSVVFYSFVPDPLDTIVIRYALLSADQDPNFADDVTDEI